MSEPEAINDLLWFVTWTFRLAVVGNVLLVLILFLKVYIWRRIIGHLLEAKDLLQMTKDYHAISQKKVVEQQVVAAETKQVLHDIKHESEKVAMTAEVIASQPNQRMPIPVPVVVVDTPWHPGDPDRRKGDSVTEGDGVRTVDPNSGGVS